jgi:hypothetical protein
MHEIVEKVDQSLCTLVSLGQILTALMNSDVQLPESTCLADLGKVIAKEAETTLEFILDYCQEGGSNAE